MCRHRQFATVRMPEGNMTGSRLPIGNAMRIGNTFKLLDPPVTRIFAHFLQQLLRLAHQENSITFNIITQTLVPPTVSPSIFRVG